MVTDLDGIPIDVSEQQVSDVHKKMIQHRKDSSVS